MHIVMLSDWETQQGGAAIAASRLAGGLCEAGQRVTRIVAARDGSRHPWTTVELNPSRFEWGLYRLAPKGLAIPFSEMQRCRGLARLLKNLQPDVINVHNLHGAAYKGWLPELAQVCLTFAPTVWTMHDMWSFTGRCAYSYDCLKYQTGCDATCPTPNEYPILAPKKIAAAWERRQQLFRNHPRLAAASPSDWLANVARSGLWEGHRIEVFPNGLPLNVYHPVDRSLARQRLNIATSGPVLLVTAFNLSDRRKGAEWLVQALRHVAHRPLDLVTLGSNPLPLEIKGVRSHLLGYLENESDIALAYNAADVYVHPALADNLPNTVMEAIACGTPVVGFNIGGVPDMVRPGQTGWLAEEITPEVLARTLQAALDDLSRSHDLRETCRAVAEVEYGAELQAQRYMTLFQSL